MLVPLSWLIEFVPLGIDPDDTAQVTELGRVFDSLGLVVESVERVTARAPGVVFARVLEIASIEGADRIRRVLVDAGADPSEIVCGAMNFEVGDVVPLATVGAVLANEMVITKRTMRGVTSNGMLCSPSELGLSQDIDGLLILARTGSGDGPLPSWIALGTSVEAALGLVDDVVFDLSVEPNRPDALCIAGIARDLAAKLGLEFSLPTPQIEASGKPAVELASVAIEAPDRCPALVAKVLTDLVPFATRPIVARRLALAGMRPINAVVDASNYVMLELGQPTHPYDLARLGGSGISVRLAREGERLQTLDGVEHTLDPDDLLICDADDEPVGLAGIMGGSSSEIAPSTTAVLLEIARFSPLGIGRATARHGIRTEASARFWRGTDPKGLSRAGDRFAEILLDAARDFAAPAPVVASGELALCPTPHRPVRITLSTAHVNARLGTALSNEQVAAYLTPLGFRPEGTNDPVEVEVPSFRPDCHLEVDLIEEVARHHGYEAIVPAPLRSPHVGRLSPLQRARREVRYSLIGIGVDEAWTSSIADRDSELRAGSTAPSVVLSNPIVAGESVLRTHVLPGLLTALCHNESHRNGSIRLFELGAVFEAPSAPATSPGERELLGVLFARDDDDAQTARSVLDRLAASLLIADGAFRVDQPLAAGSSIDPSGIALGLHPTRSALVRATSSGAVIGALGEVDPPVLAAFSIERTTAGWLVLDLPQFSRLERRDRYAKPVTHLPTSDVDLSFVVPDEIAAQRVHAALARALGDDLEACELVDVFSRPELGARMRSMAFRLRFRSFDRTLTDAEIAELRARAIERAEAELPIRLRS